MPRTRAARLATGVLTTALALALPAGCAASSGPEGAASASSSATTPTRAAPTPTPGDRGPAAWDGVVRSADLGSLATQAAVTPTRLRVDALGIDIPLDAVGVAADGQMEIPPYAERGGWYRFGATPGDDAGAVVIAAHVDSVVSEGLGPFAALTDAQPGQVAVVDLSDGTQVTYAVTARTAQAKPEVAWSDVFDRAGPPRLVLVTCGGSWRSDVRSYSDNILVTAVADTAVADTPALVTPTPSG